MEEMQEKSKAFPLLCLQDVLILLRQFHMVIVMRTRSSGDRAPPSGGGSGGSNPPGCVLFLLFSITMCLQKAVSDRFFAGREVL